MSSGGPWEGNVLQTLCFKVLLRHPKKPRDEPRNFEEGLGRVQRWSLGGPQEGHMLQTICFKVLLRHPKKPQDEPRNFEDGSRRVQGRSLGPTERTTKRAGPVGGQKGG